MSDERIRAVSAAGLVIGALFGMAGTFTPSPELRGLFWGVDGVALVTAFALIAVHHFRHGRDQLAAGFLVFLAAETLIVAGSAMDLDAVAPLFGAGATLWAAALGLISSAPAVPLFLRATGAIGAILFAITGLRLFTGAGLTPLTRPLPFFAFPFLAVTLLGWAWVLTRKQPARVGAV